MGEYSRDGNNAEGTTKDKVNILRGSSGEGELKENEKELVEKQRVKSWKPKDQRWKKTLELKCHTPQSLQNSAQKTELYTPHEPLVTSARLTRAAWVN